MKFLYDRSLDAMPDKPPLNRYLLALFLIPFFLFHKVSGLDFSRIAASGAVSWIQLALDFPEFSTQLFLYGRVFPALLGTATVFVVYRLGALMFGQLAGLFGAATLAVTQGFVVSNHYARSEPLVNLLAVLVVYLCIRALSHKNFPRYFYLAGFVAGLAVTAKYNGVILLLPVMITYLVLSFWAHPSVPFRSAIVTRLATDRILFFALALFTLGVVMGFGGNVVTMINTIKAGYGTYRAAYYGGSEGTFPVSIVNYIIHLVAIFGVPTAVFVGVGFSRFCRKSIGSRDGRAQLGVLCSFIIPYFLIASTYHLEFPYTKVIVLVVPVLSIFGGYFMSNLCRVSGGVRWVAMAGILITFLYSLAYTLAGDYFLARRDIRYDVTSWMVSNIPYGSTVEVFQQPSFLFSEVALYPLFDFVYFGNRSRSYQGSLFHPRNANSQYVEKLRRWEPSSDYFVIGELSPDIELKRLERREDAQNDLFYRMCTGLYNYRLVKKFYAWNWSERSKFIPGLSYPHSLLWYPIDASYTPTAIFIFKRAPEVNAQRAEPDWARERCI